MVIEREHRCGYLCGAHAGHVSYTLSIVTSVTRAGIARELHLDGALPSVFRAQRRRLVAVAIFACSTPSA
jgi:hypothetical protein